MTYLACFYRYHVSLCEEYQDLQEARDFLEYGMDYNHLMAVCIYDRSADTVLDLVADFYTEQEAREVISQYLSKKLNKPIG